MVSPRLHLSTLALAGVLFSTTGLAVALRAAPAPTISFNRDIRPILSENCFHCHGPDQARRKAELQLDVREAALEAKAFVPGKADESELLIRVLSTDPGEQMPPPASKLELLTPREIEILRLLAKLRS